MAKKIVVYAYVVADLLHKGHREALKQAKALGSYLIVGVITDEAAASYKRMPVIPFAERLEGIEELPYVDEVVTQYCLDPTDNLKKLGNVDILVCGDDWAENFPGTEYMRSIGKQAIRTKYYPLQSTTKIIKKISKRESERIYNLIKSKGLLAFGEEYEQERYDKT